MKIKNFIKLIVVFTVIVCTSCANKDSSLRQDELDERAKIPHDQVLLIAEAFKKTARTTCCENTKVFWGPVINEVFSGTDFHKKILEMSEYPVAKELSMENTSLSTQLIYFREHDAFELSWHIFKNEDNSIPELYDFGEGEAYLYELPDMEEFGFNKN